MEYLGIIYSWTNITNGKLYIGLSISSSVPETRKRINTPEKLLYNRWNGHKTEAICRPQDYFHHAIRKHGADNFIGKVLKIFYADTRDEVRIWSDKEEQESIIELNSICPNGYNLQGGGYSPIMHQDTKTKMRAKKQGFLNSDKGQAWKQQVSERQTNHFQSEAGMLQAKKHSENIVQLYEETPSIKSTIRNTLLEYFETEAGKAQIEKQKQFMKDFMESESGQLFKKKLSEHANIRWSDTEYRAMQITKGKERFSGDVGVHRRNNLSEKAINRFKNPEVRKEFSEKAKAYYDKIGRKEYNCELCNKLFRDKTGYDRHCNANIHRKRTEGYSAEEAEKIRRLDAGKKRRDTCKAIGPIQSSRKGISHTEEAKEKNSQAHCGKTHTEESKKKLSETIKNQYENGLRRNGLAKLTDDAVLFIRKNRGLLKQTELAAKFNVTISTISAIQLNKVYTHVKETIRNEIVFEPDGSDTNTN